jgi:hypothetical protein
MALTFKGATLAFNIVDWKAWTPAHNDAPDVSIIPAMLRRRLSPLGRAALSVIMPLAQTHGAMPLVYVSRHGDLNRTLGLLEDMAKSEPLSPTAFSLSVHNATAGLFSIQQGLTSNITAISGGAEELVPALLEALGLCSEQTPQVLCVFCDEPTPAIYQHQAAQPAHAYAVALVVGMGSELQLDHVGPAASATNSEEPQSLQLLRLLQGDVESIALAHNRSSWQLRRCLA